MRFPLGLSLRLAEYAARKSLSGRKKFPMVLTLEPALAGLFGKTQRLSVQECLDAVDECGAPIVSIRGDSSVDGQVTAELASRVLDRKKTVLLTCDTAHLRSSLSDFRPCRRFFWNIRLECGEVGDQTMANEAIAAAKQVGFQVCIDLQVEKQTSQQDLEELLAKLSGMGVDGFLISPAYGDASMDPSGYFMSRDEIREKFVAAGPLFRKYRFLTSPRYHEFLLGKRESACSAWENPTRDVAGWKGPCGVIADIHHKTYDALLKKTPWEKYGQGNDPRCRDCMLRCGFDAGPPSGVNGRVDDAIKRVRWQLS